MSPTPPVAIPERTTWIGVVGVGLMGAPMALRLVGSGAPTIVHNRTRAKTLPIERAGAAVANTLADLGARATTVFLALPSGREVDAALSELLTHLAEGSLIIDTSTIAPHEARTNHSRCAERSIGYVDAPVSGGPVAVEAGTLSVMAGGIPADLDRAALICEAFAGRFVRCGGPGAGQVAKACNQLVVAATIEVISEALVLARAAGVEPTVVREALLGGFAASRILDLHGSRMLTANYVPGGKTRLQLKDIDIIRDLARETGVPLDSFEAAALRFERLVESGGGELDHSAVVTVLEDETGYRLSVTGRSQKLPTKDVRSSG